MSTINKHCHTRVRYAFINISLTLIQSTYFVVGEPFVGSLPIEYQRASTRRKEKEQQTSPKEQIREGRRRRSD